MAKDNPADPLTEIQDILTTGRKKPMNFALMKAKDGVVLKAHVTKPSTTMLRDCKAAGGLPAMQAQGVLNVVGRVVELTLENPDVSPTLAKQAKMYLAALGLPFKVVFLLPGGIRLGDEDEAAAGALPEAEDDSPEAALRKALMQEYEALLPRLEAARRDATPEAIRKLEAIVRMFVETIARDPRKARGILTLMVTTLEVVMPVISPAGRPKSWTNDLIALEKDLDLLLSEFA